MHPVEAYTKLASKQSQTWRVLALSIMVHLKFLVAYKSNTHDNGHLDIMVAKVFSSRT